MKYLVQICQNLTACDTILRGPRTTRIISEELFDTEEEAIQRYNSHKSMFRFAGLAGQYCSYPKEVESDYKIFPHRCDECGEGFESENYLGVSGDYCSRTCFRNSFQRASSYEEDYYE